MIKQSQRKLVVGVTVGVSALTLLRGQLEWFSRNGWDVTLVASDDPQARKAADREQVRFVGIPMYRAISPFNDLKSLWLWVKFLRSEKPDAVNVGTPKAALLGIIAAFITRVPRRLYTVRGLRLEGSNGLLAVVLWLMERVTMGLATDVFFVSESLAAEANRRRLLPKSKSWLVGSGSSNGVNSNAIQQRISSVDQEELRSHLGFSSDDFIVGFIGRIGKDKGVETIFNALNDPNLDENVRVLFIGDTDDEDLRFRIEMFGNRVKMTSWTSDVWGLLPALHVLCLPTIREGFPNVVLECAAASVPAITTRATGAIDSVIEGETGYLLDVGDSSRLVDLFNKFQMDRELLDKLGKQARERVIKDFQQENIWLGIEEIISAKSDPIEAKVFQKRSRSHSAN